MCRQREGGVVVHRPVSGPLHDVELVALGDLDRLLQVNLLHLLRDDIDGLDLVLPDGPMTGWAFSRAPDHRSLLLTHSGRVLVARAQGERVDLAQGEIDVTMYFLPVTTADFGALRETLASRWLVQSDEPQRPLHAELSPGFLLRLGSLALDLRWNVPFDLSEFPHRMTVVRDGWRIDRLVRYRPLVFYTVFGDTGEAEQLKLSLQSLIGPAAYDGDVAVLTDLGVDQIRALKPSNMAGAIVVIHCEVADDAARYAGRLAIAGWPDARTFQPMMYVDTDVMFDQPVGPLLRALATADHIAAPEAPADTDPITLGAELAREDAWDPADMAGFATTVLGIPNLGRHGHTLDLIGRIMRNRASLFGRDALPRAEQAVANYVSLCLGPFDTDLITPLLRQADAALDETEAVGLMHFGKIQSGEERLAQMREYLRRIGGMMPGDVVPTGDVAAFSMTPLLDFESIMRSLQP